MLLGLPKLEIKSDLAAMFSTLKTSVAIIGFWLSLAVDSAVVPTSLATFVSGPGGVRFIGAAGTRVGYAVSMIGDYNNDGLQDYAVSSLFATLNNRPNCGLVVIVLGRNSGANVEVDISTVSSGLTMRRIIGGASTDYLGESMAPIGDINKDGFADIMIGAPNTDRLGRTNVGVTFVIFGKASTSAYTDLDLISLTSVDGFQIIGTEANQKFGANVDTGLTSRALGDVNGDNIDDFAVSYVRSTYNARVQAGIVWFIFGKTTTFSNIDLASFSGGVVLGGAVTGDLFGYSIANVGDFNGDGKADLMIGAKEATVNSMGARGAAYLLYGVSTFASRDMSTFVTGAAGILFLGGAAGDKAGTCVCGAGDLNGDGKADILVGAENADAPSRFDGGKVYVIFGFSTDYDLGTLVAGPQGYTVISPQQYRGLGVTLSRAGDLDQDGFVDFIVASRTNFQVNVYVIYGTAGTPTADIDLLTYDGKLVAYQGFGSADSLGQSVYGGVDVNGDGIPDLLIGAPQTQLVPAGGGSSRSGAGAAYLIYGPVYPSTRTPTVAPSLPPSLKPSAQPSMTPSETPSATPSEVPSAEPSLTPSATPSEMPSLLPSVAPSAGPSELPSVTPSMVPSVWPTVAPSADSSATPSVSPSVNPSMKPSVMPSVDPSALPSVSPTLNPSVEPSVTPTITPSPGPSVVPTVAPSVVTSAAPSVSPSLNPSAVPSVIPTTAPSAEPSVAPSTDPSAQPSFAPSPAPSAGPTVSPTAGPSTAPTTQPTQVPTARPSQQPFQTVLGVEQVLVCFYTTCLRNHCFSLLFRLFLSLYS